MSKPQQIYIVRDMGSFEIVDVFSTKELAETFAEDCNVDTYIEDWAVRTTALDAAMSQLVGHIKRYSKKRMIVTNSQGGYADLTYADDGVRLLARLAFESGHAVTVMYVDGVATYVGRAIQEVLP